MDIAYFISDLLGEQGELSVPNLGYFVQMRMSAYYNEQEKKFYPPHYAIQFDPQVIDDDDTLATHIHERKKISAASAKYFIEKYITGLREQALSEDVPFGGIGYFSTNGAQLVFHPSPKTDDASLFGFKPVDAYRTGQERPQPVTPPVEITPAPVAETEKPAYTPPAPEATPTPAYVPQVEQPVKGTLPEQLPVQQEVETNYEYQYEEERRGISPWLIVGIVLVVLVGAAAALYKFKPELFGQFLSLHKDPYQNSAPAKAPVKADTTVNTPVNPAQDTVVQSTVPQVDTVADQPKGNAAKPVIRPEKGGSKNASATSEPVETKPVNTVTKKPESKPEVIVKKPVATEPSTIAADVDVPKGMFVIRAGAFPTKSGAYARLEQLKRRGFTQARLEKKEVGKGGNYKVILGAFTNRKDAVDNLIELKGTNKFDASENIHIEKN